VPGLEQAVSRDEQPVPGPELGSQDARTGPLPCLVAAQQGEQQEQAESACGRAEPSQAPVQ
jgi:hypothetical protein